MCPKKRYNPVLDPFCNICGKYKGIGSCLNPNCRGYDSKSDIGSQTVLKGSDSCRICGNPVIVRCHVCNQGYCNTHAQGMNNQHLHYKDQHIGTCAKCNSYVCENCWILNASGAILCLYHLEKRENSSNE